MKRPPLLRIVFGRERELSLRGRLAFFAGGLVALGAAYKLTGSEGVQFLVLFALVLGVLPALRWRYGDDDPYMRAVWDRDVPLRFFFASVACALPWWAVVLFVPVTGLGPSFWFWLALWPWAELQRLFVERALRRGDAARWPEARPTRAVAICSLLLVPAVATMMLVDGAGIVAALAAGVAAGAIIFAELWLIFALFRRAQAQVPAP